MKYTRNLDNEFSTEAERRGIDTDQLPSGEQHLFRQKAEKHMDECLEEFVSVYFDQLEERGHSNFDQVQRKQAAGNVAYQKKQFDIVFGSLGISNPLGGGEK